MYKILGVVFLSTPFIGLFFLGKKLIGIKAIINVFEIVGVVVLNICLGIYLLSL